MVDDPARSMFRVSGRVNDTYMDGRTVSGVANFTASLYVIKAHLN